MRWPSNPKSRNRKKQAFLDLAHTWTQAAFQSERTVVVTDSPPKVRTAPESSTMKTRYTISTDNLGGFSVPRETAGEAIQKAAELTGNGMKDVHITDTETGRKYRHHEFSLLVIGK